MASLLRMKSATALLARSAAIRAPAARCAILPNLNLTQTSRLSIDPSKRLFSASSYLNGEYIAKVPPMAESINEGTIGQLKELGEEVGVDEEVASVETDKIDVAVTTPEGGVIREYFVSDGDTVVVGQDVCRIETGAEGTKSQKPQEESKPKKEESKEEAPKPQEETKKPEPKPQETKPAPAKESKPRQSAPSTGSEPPKQFSRGERQEKLSRMRKTIAGRLKQSQDTCASLTTVQEIDMTNLMAWRKKYRDEVAEEHGVKLGYMGAFTKATTMAAIQIPQVNAAIDTDKEIITYRDYVDISIAVSGPKGLVTPVLKNAESLSIVELERQVATLAKKARDGKLTMPDLEGGNYSISNPGIFGSMFGTPLINYPQAAIFNMNGIQQRVVAVNGQAEIRPMMYVTLTYDHRLIDGREAIAFLNLVKKYVEDPSRMLLF